MKINSKNEEIVNYIDSLNNVLDGAIHGHKNAKIQIERLIGQWINGEKTGYCFGFEGPPGIGKTSLAKKGIANCLKDSNGKSRPFSFIALGGSSNGSILEGHNYTYVGSNYGKIVDIPSHKVKPGDVIEIKDASQDLIIIQHTIDTGQDNVIPSWLDVDNKKKSVKINAEPSRGDASSQIEEQLIVELYSK